MVCLLQWEVYSPKWNGRLHSTAQTQKQWRQTALTNETYEDEDGAKIIVVKKSSWCNSVQLNRPKVQLLIREIVWETSNVSQSVNVSSLGTVCLTTMLTTVKMLHQVLRVSAGTSTVCWGCCQNQLGRIFDFQLSEGSVATYCMYGGNLSGVCIENFPRNQLLKEFWKSVHICQRYYQTSRGILFFETQCKQEVKVIWQKAPHGGPIPRLGVTPGGRKLYHWIPGVGFPISVP